MKRRNFLTGLAAVGAAAAVGLPLGWNLTAPSEQGALLRSRARLPAPFTRPLPIPHVLTPTERNGTAEIYDIVQLEADLEILPGLRTRAWTYGGTFPGPTIVAESGRLTHVRHTNTLPGPTTVHLHGGHTPHDSDGYPLDLVLPVGSTPAQAQAWTTAGMGAGGHAAANDAGIANMPGMSTTDMTSAAATWQQRGTQSNGAKTYTYPTQQRAATLWYHDHRMGFTAPDVWRGLAGFHLVTDEQERSLGLPDGDRDIPLMIADRSFEADGSFRYPSLDPTLTSKPGTTDAYMNGVLGDVILVNGAPWPALQVDRVRYRFRILNASNARRYRLALDQQPPGGKALVQIGSDGGLLEHPQAFDSIDIAPAERFDIVLDFGRFPPGSQVTLVNQLGDGTTGVVMRFDVSTAQHAPVDTSQVPTRLSTIERLDPTKAVRTRTFQFRRSAGTSGWTINGKPYTPGSPLAAPKLGDVEIWQFVTDFHHPIHIHLDPFQVLGRNATGPGPFDSGWKDTIDLRPAEVAQIAVRFTDYAGLFLLHCHNLEHEDMAMMADIITV